MAGEGVISDMLKAHQVDGNFLHGSIEYIQEEPLGIFIMELKGEKQEIEKALQYIENRAAQVEVINHGIWYQSFDRVDSGNQYRFFQTIYMISISLIVAVVIGLPIGVILYITDKGLFMENGIIHNILGFIVNLIRSIPFLILLVALIPFTNFLVGTTIGPTAASVSLSVAAIPFLQEL